MQIGTVDYNLAMTRPQELTNIRQNEENKTNLDASVFQNVVDKKSEEKAVQVGRAEDTDTGQKQQDAADQGSNQYEGDGGARRREHQEIPVEGRVIRKKVPHFEMKV